MHKAISLSAETAEVRNAIEGARFLADERATGGMEDRKRKLQAPVRPTSCLAWGSCARWSLLPATTAAIALSPRSKREAGECLNASLLRE